LFNISISFYFLLDRLIVDGIVAAEENAQSRSNDQSNHIIIL